MTRAAPKLAAVVVSVLTMAGVPAGPPLTSPPGGDAGCVNCPPAPLPCPPCFACIQTGPDGPLERIPVPECPFPPSAHS